MQSLRCICTELNVSAPLDVGGKFEEVFVAYFINMCSKDINFMKYIL